MVTVDGQEPAPYDGLSEKYSLRTRTGLAFPSQVESCAANGSAPEAGRVDHGSGASAFAMILASGRTGSFSPAGPVSTACVIRLP